MNTLPAADRHPLHGTGRGRGSTRGLTEAERALRVLRDGLGGACPHAGERAVLAELLDELASLHVPDLAALGEQLERMQHERPVFAHTPIWTIADALVAAWTRQPGWMTQLAAARTAARRLNVIDMQLTTLYGAQSLPQTMYLWLIGARSG